MMHRCQGNNMVGPCSCGLFHGGNTTSCFSMLFSMPDHHHHKSYDQTTTDLYSFTSSSSSSSSSSVDCTLSLGTPSTRLSDQDDNKKQRSRSMSNFCWDIWQSKTSSSSTYAPAQQPHKTSISRGSNNGSSSSCNSTNDPLLARRCANCDTTSTPLWRNGPRGPKSLCNACGIRFKKEERRATAANASGGGGASSGGVMEQQQSYSSWVNHQSQQQSAQRVPCYSQANEFRFIENSSDLDSADHHNNTGIPFLSWRLNVTDRPTSLVHDFTG